MFDSGAYQNRVNARVEASGAVYVSGEGVTVSAGTFGGRRPKPK